ncbi:MAG: hypothetical protein WCJ81_07965 [bacterium]
MLIFFLIISVISGGMWIYQSISFKQNCSGHLRRAATANTVDLAEKELSKALQYLETNNLTSGSTHIFYATPDNDIEYWYANIKAGYEELKSVQPSASLQEKTNILMKLRESLLSHSGDSGDTVIVPPRIAIYPDQVLIFLGTFLGILFLAIWAKFSS